MVAAGSKNTRYATPQVGDTRLAARRRPGPQRGRGVLFAGHSRNRWHKLHTANYADLEPRDINARSTGYAHRWPVLHGHCRACRREAVIILDPHPGDGFRLALRCGAHARATVLSCRCCNSLDFSLSQLVQASCSAQCWRRSFGVAPSPRRNHPRGKPAATDGLPLSSPV